MTDHPGESKMEHVKPSPEPLERSKEAVLLEGVTVNVMAVDGTDGGHQLSERELELLSGAHELLMKEGVRAKLQKVEANRMMKETEDGYLYLVLEGALEFWAHVGKSARVNLETGKVGVVL